MTPQNWNDGSEDFNKIHRLKSCLRDLVAAVERRADPILLNSEALELAKKELER